MTIADGMYRRVAYGVETTWGSAAASTGAQTLRRITSDLDLAKETYQSEEKRSDFQISDFRHGVRSIRGNITGHLSAGTYKDFIAHALRRAFGAVTPTTANVTISTGGPTYDAVRTSGSWLTDGYKVGDIGRFTAGTFNASNLNNNVMAVSVTAGTMALLPLNGGALVAEGPISSGVFTLTGKKTYVPGTGHTDSSLSIEHYHQDVSPTISELFLGCKVPQMDLDLPPTGMSRIAMQIMGKDVTKSTGAGYFTSPAAETSAGILAAVNGVLLVNGTARSVVTGARVSIAGNHSATPVVGSNSYPQIFPGRVIVGGQFTAYFQDDVERAAFDGETELSLILAMTENTAGTAGFMGLTLPRIKLGSASKDDPEGGVQQTCSFQAIKNVSGGTGTSSEATTISIQDSAA